MKIKLGQYTISVQKIKPTVKQPKNTLTITKPIPDNIANCPYLDTKRGECQDCIASDEWFNCPAEQAKFRKNKRHI